MRVDVTTFGSPHDEFLERFYCRDCGAEPPRVGANGADNGWATLAYWGIIELAMEAFLDGDDR